MSDLQNIQEAILILGKKIDEQNARLVKLENVSGIKSGVQAEMAAREYEKVERTEPESASSLEFVAQQEATQSEVESLRIEENSKTDFEENIGVKWFARIGITALILGLSFFLKYAFDNNWIGPVGRVAIGIFAGLVLLGLGEKFIRKYFMYGQIISGGGIAVLYLSIYAAMNFYQLITSVPAFLMMTLITAVGIVLSLRYDAISLMIVSVVGGFATPFLVSTGQNNQIALFSYVLLLDLSILVVSIFKKWRELNFIGFIGTGLTFVAWASTYYTKEQLGITMLFLTLFFIVYSISSLIYNLVKKEKSSGTEQALTLLSGIIYFVVSFSLLDHDYHSFMGFFTLILAIYYFLWAYTVKALTPEDENLYTFLALLTVGFVTLAIPIQFKAKVITLCWLIESIVMFYLGLSVKKDMFKALGLVVFILSLGRLFFIDSEFVYMDLTLVNKTFLTFVLAIIITYLAAYLFKKYGTEDEPKDNYFQYKQLVLMFIIVANFLTIFAFSREIVFYYDQQINELEKVQVQSYKDPLARPTSVSIGKSQSEQIRSLNSRESVVLSLFWLLYSILLLIVGIFARYRFVRIIGIVVLCISIFKLFFIDLWNLGTLYRIISSISLGVVLLSISFAYQKYKDRITQII